MVMRRYSLGNLPIDPAAVAVDRAGQICITSPAGVIRFYERR